MWMKIAAGVAAALAVVVVGVFVALPQNPAENGCGKCHTSNPQGETATVSGACPTEATGCPLGPPLPPNSATAPPCCNIAPAKAVNNDALAACAGGLAVQPAPTAKFHCCDE